MGYIVSVPRDEDEVDSESVKGESTLLFFSHFSAALFVGMHNCCCSVAAPPSWCIGGFLIINSNARLVVSRQQAGSRMNLRL